MHIFLRDQDVSNLKDDLVDFAFSTRKYAVNTW